MHKPLFSIAQGGDPEKLVVDVLSPLGGYRCLKAIWD
jgi:hypothetical protein